ncbi:MAG: 60S ribosomal export protein NMD3 [Archaeoglobaceae archaeon]
MRCIVCGKESKFKICGSCFAERNTLAHLPSLELEKCGKCGSFRFGREWVWVDERSAIEREVFRNLAVFPDFSVESVEILKNSAVIKGTIYGDCVSLTIPLNLRTRTITCPRCSKESGGYYEAVVQVRAQNRSLRKEELEKAREIVESVLSGSKGEKDFLLKFEETKSGIDFYFGSRKIGEKVSKMIADELGGSVFRSKKLHTRVDGNDVYRFTFLVRLFEAEDYDVVLKDGKVCIVKNAKLQKGIELMTGKAVNVSGATLIAKKEEMSWGVITNLDESVAEVMDSEGRIFHVPRSFGAEIGKEVFIFNFGQRIFAFPKDL